MSDIEQIIEGYKMDMSVHKELPALLSLAHDKSEAGRVVLCKKLAEVFLAPSADLSSHEEKLVNQLIEDLLKSSSPAVRQALISAFAAAIDAPRALAVRIVNGPIELARPILVANENLADEDLVEVIQKKGSDHAATIATRKQINEAVADALVATGDLTVMQIVAENMGATLSKKALDILVAAARLSSPLQKPIMARPDLNPDSAMQLFWWVSKDLRRVTLERFGYGPGKLDLALRKATEDILTALLLQKEDDNAMRSLADWMTERGALTTQILPHLLRMNHYRLFNIALSRLSRLDLSVVDKINSGVAGGRMMVILCRALGIEKGNFVSIFLMARGARADDQIVHPRELSIVMEAYDKLQPEMAKAMIENWRIDPSAILQRSQEQNAMRA